MLFCSNESDVLGFVKLLLMMPMGCMVASSFEERKTQKKFFEFTFKIHARRPIETKPVYFQVGPEEEFFKCKLGLGLCFF
jgi:hypothetical protein